MYKIQNTKKHNFYEIKTSLIGKIHIEYDDVFNSTKLNFFTIDKIINIFHKYVCLLLFELAQKSDEIFNK